MWEKADRQSEALRRITVAAVLLLVLVQLTVFIIKAGRMFREGPPEPVTAVQADTVFIHDTVYIRRERYSGGWGGTAATGGSAAAGHSDDVPGRSSGAGDARVRVRVEAGADSWKWDVVELNTADSAELDALPGIGGYYAKSILRYRARLKGFVRPEQLMEIRGLDSSRYVALAPRVAVDTSLVVRIDLLTAPEDSLALHPYIGRMAAKGIVRLRGVLPPGEVTLEAVVENGILTAAKGERLRGYVK